jgi:RNA polymerase sigma-70 factor, ECF subfamily
MGELQAHTGNSSCSDDMVVRARTDPQALGSLYDCYYEKVFRYCLHRLFKTDVAADVTSSVFLHVATNICRFTGTRDEDFRNWLYAISTNQINAWIRSTRRRDELLESAVASGRLKIAAADPAEAETVEWPRLYQAIAKLKPRHQTIITLRFFEDVPYEQIAHILQSSPASLRAMTFRALRKLRRILSKSAGKAGNRHV